MKRNWLKVLMLGLAVGLATACSKEAIPNTSQQNTKQDKKPVTIYLVRHGKTMLNTTDRSQGWIDAPLTPAGIEVAKNLGKGLLADKIKFDAAYSSDSGRAQETAKIVLENNKQSPLIKGLVTNQDLREVNFGSFEGMPNEEMWTKIANAQGKTLEEWQEGMTKDGFVATIKGFTNTLSELDKANAESGKNWPAEDYDTVQKRAKSALDKIVKDAQKKDYSNVLVTSHGMTLAILVSYLDEAAPVPATGLKNASVQKVTYDQGKYSVQTVNDMSYVEKGQAN